MFFPTIFSIHRYKKWEILVLYPLQIATGSTISIDVVFPEWDQYMCVCESMCG